MRRSSKRQKKKFAKRVAETRKILLERISAINAEWKASKAAKVRASLKIISDTPGYFATRISPTTFKIHNLQIFMHYTPSFIPPHSPAFSECSTTILKQLERAPFVAIIEEYIDLDDIERTYNELTQHSTKQPIIKESVVIDLDSD